MTADTKLLPLPESDCQPNALRWLFPVGQRERVQDYARACVAHATAAKDAEIEALRARTAEIEALRARTAVTMGVGTGDGRLFIHGDYESVKAAQAIVLQRDALRAEVERLQEIVRPKREEECMTLDHWRMRAYDLEANWSRCSRACADEQTKRVKAEASAERLAEAWQEGYRQGVLDERASEDNIGIAGFGAKVEPARNNPYALAQQPASSAPDPATGDAVAMQPVAEVAMSDDGYKIGLLGPLRAHRLPLGTKLYASPRAAISGANAPVGVEAALSLLRAGHWREVHVGRRYMRLEVTYDYAAWERLMEQVEAALAGQQPAAVEEAWQVQLADALECFWNPAIEGSGDDRSNIIGGMAQGFAAVANRLREHADQQGGRSDDH